MLEILIILGSLFVMNGSLLVFWNSYRWVLILILSVAILGAITYVTVISGVSVYRLLCNVGVDTVVATVAGISISFVLTLLYAFVIKKQWEYL